MEGGPGRELSKLVEETYRREARRVFATLIRLLGDFDPAEEALWALVRGAGAGSQFRSYWRWCRVAVSQLSQVGLYSNRKASSIAITAKLRPGTTLRGTTLRHHATPR